MGSSFLTFHGTRRGFLYFCGLSESKPCHVRVKCGSVQQPLRDDLSHVSSSSVAARFNSPSPPQPSE